jgi:long-chain acyl-CoA synthetase
MSVAVTRSTRSRTMADLLGRAVDAYGDQVAVRHKVDGAWRDVTYREVGEIVTEIALGLVGLGVEADDRWRSCARRGRSGRTSTSR